MTELQDKLADMARKQQALEDSIAALVAEVLTMGAFEVKRQGHNVVTMWQSRGGENVEVQLIVKVGSAHEVRDDLWDAIMDRQDMDTSCTDYANAAMERLGFQRPEGGWPK
jgi:hypothetical protein